MIPPDMVKPYPFFFAPQGNGLPWLPPGASRPAGVWNLSLSCGRVSRILFRILIYSLLGLFLNTPIKGGFVQREDKMSGCLKEPCLRRIRAGVA